jgi:hypothetical protein
MKEAEMAGLSFVTLLAYDWKYAFEAIRSYYGIADEIILGLDADRISMSKKPFPFDDQAVAEFIAAIDTDKKIRVIQDNFHALDTPMDNETAERKQLGAACRAGNWVVQIDADEVLLNPLDWKSYFDGLSQDARIYANWLPVYKIIGDKALVVAGQPEAAPVATRSPHLYRYARVTDQSFVLSSLFMLHLCWCRSEEELVQKLTHWSHSTEINIEKTVGLWRATTLENYHRLKDFHPLHPPLWQFLKVMDWPPKALADGHFSLKQAVEWLAPPAPKPQMVVQGKTAGGMLISFETPATGPQNPAT